MRPGIPEVAEEDKDRVAPALAVLDKLRPGLSGSAQMVTLVHLLLAHERFENVYGHTKGLPPDAEVELYADHLLLPLRVLLLHPRGTDQLAGLGHEAVRRVLGHYLELVLMLMPNRSGVVEGMAERVSSWLVATRKTIQGLERGEADDDQSAAELLDYAPRSVDHKVGVYLQDLGEGLIEVDE